MTAFPLRIVTPDGMKFDGLVRQVTVRTATGDMGILAGHINCVASLGMGQATVVLDDKKRCAACIGGILSVSGGSVTLVPTTFEWAEEIDDERAARAAACAQAVINDKKASAADISAAEAKLKRALVRRSVAQNR